ncbi:MAG: hypothetical protein NC123_19235 [Butyrivibrio sp.]|nr:hypothetical protein [Butyrivibrio sp.]
MDDAADNDAGEEENGEQEEDLPGTTGTAEKAAAGTVQYQDGGRGQKYVAEKEGRQEAALRLP